MITTNNNLIIYLWAMQYLDVTLTTFMLYTMKQITPNWHNFELNFIIKNIFKKFGVLKGFFVAYFYSAILLYIIILGATLTAFEELLWILVGMYAVVIVLHLVNISYLITTLNYIKIFKKNKIRRIQWIQS